MSKRAEIKRLKGMINRLLVAGNSMALRLNIIAEKHPDRQVKNKAREWLRTNAFSFGGA